MMQDRNFYGQTNLDIEDTYFYRCNFTQPEPQFVEDKWRGIQVFAENTPRTFVECNLCNVEPPSGSTIQNCLTVVKQFDVEVSGTYYDKAYGYWIAASGNYEYYESIKIFEKEAV